MNSAKPVIKLSLLFHFIIFKKNIVVVVLFFFGVLVPKTAKIMLTLSILKSNKKKQQIYAALTTSVLISLRGKKILYRSIRWKCKSVQCARNFFLSPCPFHWHNNPHNTTAILFNLHLIAIGASHTVPFESKSGMSSLRHTKIFKPFICVYCP